ncbi:MAG TPA: endonuclease/exonuclease/phosphatase family protein [Verrucomicrobiae bacterium]|nr:endonuclease/exonuclease/phosphatase family protein [Verrucomicrobiae bacterium]
MLPFSVMTYNVHSCRGTDGRLSPARIASLIMRCRPDIIALQELDANLSRSGLTDQVKAISEALRMGYHFQPSLFVEEGAYGNALLSHYPMRLVKAAELPCPPGRSDLEKRGALWVEVELPGRRVQVINTHLGLNLRERVVQATALVGGEWLGHPDFRTPSVLCGDLNSIPGFSAHRVLGKFLTGAQQLGGRATKTWPSRWPLLAIDHVFVSGGIVVRGVRAVRDPLARLASDHLPLMAELVLP